ncbi:MAG TPA: ABC transporter permease [Vicinamibacterales bacterium]|nr:ABC transporter permease [Vicinamibacterales bacterium]
MTLFTLLRIGWINITRDRVVQAMMFLLPMMFFSIFAAVFGNQSDPTSRIRVAVVDEDQTEYSKGLIKALEAEGGLRVQRTATAVFKAGPVAENDQQPGQPLDRAGAEALVRNGDVPVAVIIPKGTGASNKFFSEAGSPERPKVSLLADVSDPIAPQVVSGLLQKVAFTAAPQTMAVEGLAMFEKFTGPLTPEQRRTVDEWQKGGGPDLTSASAGGVIGLPIEVVNVMQGGNENASMVSFYAAGIGVMFLLFSCSGAGGTLLDEEESGTLDRLIGSRAGMTGVIVGKWVFLTIMGIVQLTVMFTWGAIAFGLPLLSHLPGFFIVTVFTAAAAAAFGLVLATLSRSRAQLSGLSTIIILAMSAVGGSMFPRFLMSDTMQKFGLLTFNGWALDAYLKVFWRELPLIELWPQLAVLTTLAAVFLMTSRMLARRWETT